MNEEYQPQTENQNYETPGVSNNLSNNYVTYIPFGLNPKTYKEKNNIKKSAVIVGSSLLIMLGISFVWSIIYVFVMGRLGFSMQKAMEMISDDGIMQELQIILSTVMFTIPFIVIYKSNGIRISDIVALNKPKKRLVFPLFLAGISLCSFANIAVSTAGSIFSSFGIKYNVDMGNDPKGFFGFLLSLIATAIVPPLIEEFGFRGIVLGSLKKYGEGFAVLVSSILFGIMHGNFEQIPFAFLVGLVLGFVTIKSGSIWTSVLIHSFNNFVSVFFTYFMNGVSANVQNIIYSVFLIVCLLLGIISVIILSKSNNDIFTFKKSELETTEKVKCKWFFSSPAIIIFIVISFLESCIYFFRG